MKEMTFQEYLFEKQSTLNSKPLCLVSWSDHSVCLCVWILQAKEKRGWTLNSAGYLLGPRKYQLNIHISLRSILPLRAQAASSLSCWAL